MQKLFIITNFKRLGLFNNVYSYVVQCNLELKVYRVHFGHIFSNFVYWYFVCLMYSFIIKFNYQIKQLKCCSICVMEVKLFVLKLFQMIDIHKLYIIYLYDSWIYQITYISTIGVIVGVGNLSSISCHVLYLISIKFRDRNVWHYLLTVGLKFQIEAHSIIISCAHYKHFQKSEWKLLTQIIIYRFI